MKVTHSIIDLNNKRQHQITVITEGDECIFQDVREHLGVTKSEILGRIYRQIEELERTANEIKAFYYQASRPVCDEKKTKQ